MVVKLKGLSDIQRKMNRQLKRIGEGSKQGLIDVALDLQGKSTERAPIDTGDLRGSGYMSTFETPKEFTVEVGFNTVYAVRQHEELNYNHPKGGEAKYLERPLNENISQYVNHIRKKVSV